MSTRTHRSLQPLGRPARLQPVAMAVALAASSLAQASSSGVVISQLYGGNGNAFASDYVELFNAGSNPVDITGWSVQYASATGTGHFANNGISTLSGTLQPGQYHLVKLKTTTGTALPTPDTTGNSSTDLSGSNGKVILANTSTGLACNGSSGQPCNATQLAQIVDLVGYGTANFREGSAAAPAASATLALFRANGGCTDTDSNSANFATGTPAPRNSTSPLNVCSGGGNNAPIVPVCGTLSLAAGAGGTAAVTASDADGIVNALAFVGTPPAGVTLGTFNAALANGGTANGQVIVDPSVPAGSTAVPLRWTNAAGDTANCTLNVVVASGLSYTPTFTIQGSSAQSPLVGQTVTTRGVVTKVNNNGYFIQDPTGDGNPASSDGLFVFTSSAPTVSLNQLVEVTGQVAEYAVGSGASATARPVTELANITATTVLGTGSISPTVITLPEAFDDELERYEGMLVTINTPLTASQNYFQGRYGQVTLSAGGRLVKPTNQHRPGTPAALSQQIQNNRASILLDDGSSVQNPNPTPFFAADNTLRAGDTVSSVTGVIDFGLATSSSDGLTDYKIHPTQPLSFTRANARPATAPAVGGNVKVAAFNVLNYFNGNGAGGGFPTSRGADTLIEFNRQRDKIIGAIAAMNADVVGLMEIENDGQGSSSAIQDLVNGLNSVMGASTYAVVPAPATGFGSDEIKVALIYKPASLSLVGASLSDTDAIHNRPPVAQGFSLLSNGQKFGVIVNHFKSKGCGDAAGADSDQGDGQGCYNSRRTQQAARLLSFMSDVQVHIGDNDIAVIGDLNAYGVEDPIHTLTQGGLVNQMSAFNALPYSYVFDGEAGNLDHGLTTASLSSQVTGAAFWHINADEPSVIDYNTEFKQPACGTCGPDYYTASAYRSSDHDPVLLGLNLLATQTLNFPAVADQTIGSAAIVLGATASSGLPVSYASVTPAVCAVGGTNVTLLAAGVCTVSADQAGNATYAAAAQAQVSFNVAKGAQSIAFGALAAQSVGASVALAATASSGLAVSYTSLTPAVCSVSGAVATALAAGTCQVQATQAGDAAYQPATAVTQSFAVNGSTGGEGGNEGSDGDVPIGPFWLLLQGLGLLALGQFWQRKRREA